MSKYYIPQEQVDEYINDTQGLTQYGYAPATKKDVENILNKKFGEGNWTIVSNELWYTKYKPYMDKQGGSLNTSNPSDDIKDMIVKDKNNTSTTDTSTTTNNNSTITNEDTINGVTTEEQAPTSETPKEGNTINGTEDDDIKITELGGNNSDTTKTDTIKDNTTNVNKSEAFNKFKNNIKNTLGDDVYNKIVQGGNILTEDIINESLKKLGYKDVNDAMGDYNALLEYYANGGDGSEVDINGPLANLAARSSIGAAKPIYYVLKGVAKALGWPIEKLLNSAVGKGLAKLGLGYRASAAAGVPLMGLEMAQGDTERKNYDKDGNVLPYWKHALWGLAYGADKTLLLGIPSSIIELLGNDVPRENPKDIQEKEKAEYKASKKFKESDTYKGITSLDKIAKKYGQEERQIADTLMNNAIAIMNHYGLNPGNGSVDNESWFGVFNYDPKTHNWYINDDEGGKVSIFDYIEGLSNIK